MALSNPQAARMGCGGLRPGMGLRGMTESDHDLTILREFKEIAGSEGWKEAGGESEE
jgi:hypothetical protein